MHARRLVMAVVICVTGCGAKTGLDVHDGGAGFGADCDAGTAPIDPGSCSDEAYALAAEPAELELTIAMDTSGSMKEPTAEGVAKLDAVRSAVSAFLLEPASAGIAVSIAFFPIVRPEVPESCYSDVECGPGGSCQLFSACSNDGSWCVTDADCPPYAVCFAGGWCENSTVCDASAYQPAHDPLLLPLGAQTLIAQFSSKLAEGATPTAPALGGAHQAAKEQREKSPGKKQVVLLATDGLPTACDPAIPGPNVKSSAGIPKVVQVAEQGRAGGVETFVIGVFSPDEEAIAQKNLDAIASAGGSESAYIITTDETVTTRFLDTLNDIRTEAADCSYALPTPGGVPLDATRLAVRLTGPAMTWWLSERISLAECDPLQGGFVFDRDPHGSVPPSRLELCPASCALLESDPTLAVEIVADCKL